MEYLKVSSKSSPASVAGAIAGMVKDGVPVNLQAVGAGAVNQAIKAVAIARGFLIPVGLDISCAPTFSDILIDGQSRTAIRIAVYVHALSSSSEARVASVGALEGGVASEPADRVAASDAVVGTTVPVAPQRTSVTALAAGASGLTEVRQ